MQPVESLQALALAVPARARSSRPTVSLAEGRRIIAQNGSIAPSCGRFGGEGAFYRLYYPCTELPTGSLAQAGGVETLYREGAAGGRPWSDARRKRLRQGWCSGNAAMSGAHCNGARRQPAGKPPAQGRPAAGAVSGNWIALKRCGSSILTLMDSPSKR